MMGARNPEEVQAVGPAHMKRSASFAIKHQNMSKDSVLENHCCSQLIFMLITQFVKQLPQNAIQQ